MKSKIQLAIRFFEEKQFEVSSPKNTFCRFKFIWFKKEESILKQINLFHKLPEFHIGIERNFRIWYAWFLEAIGIRKTNKYVYTNLLGPLLSIPFLDQFTHRAKADFIVSRVALVAIYTRAERPFVVKLNLLPNTRKYLVNEVNTLLWLRENMESNGKFPIVLDYSLEGDYPYFTQDYKQSKSLNSLGRNSRNLILTKVATFMYSVYEKYGVKYCSVNTYVEKGDLPDHFSFDFKLSISNFQALEDHFRQILSDNKKIPVSLVHGDLNLNNILVLENEDFYLIDWAASGEKPIIMDCANENHKGFEFYSLVIDESIERKHNLLSVKEQKFFLNFLKFLKYYHRLNRIRMKQIFDLKEVSNMQIAMNSRLKSINRVWNT